MNDLMISVSGIRGIFGLGINPELVMRFAAHFGLFQKKRYESSHQKIKILLGRDTRTTGETLAHAAMAGLLGVGVDVVYLGIVATPTLLLNVKEQVAQGGICITASHNPGQWNALKFVDSNGMFLFPEAMNDFIAILEKDIGYVEWDMIGRKSDDLKATERHLKKILSIEYIDFDEIRKMKYKVVLDSVNGAGCVISAKLLRELGCEVIEINNEPTGIFAHPPEPLSGNLSQICEAVKQYQADIGFATDPDVDRLAIINEFGECIGEEFSLLLAEKYILSHKKGDIVTNLSSSMASEDIAREFGVNVIRTKIGEIHVGKMMQEINSPIGGEGNGGIICPDVNYTRDAVVGMALIIASMCKNKKTISQLVSEIPCYYFAKNKIEIPTERINMIMDKAENLYPDTRMDKTDGIKIIQENSWIHIRKSGTEPIIRIYVEATTPEKAEELCQDTIAKLT